MNSFEFFLPVPFLTSTYTSELLRCQHLVGWWSKFRPCSELSWKSFMALDPNFCQFTSRTHVGRTYRGEVLYLTENRSEYFRVWKLCAQEVKGLDGGALKWTIIQCKKKSFAKKNFALANSLISWSEKGCRLKYFPLLFFNHAENFLNISGTCNSCNEWFCSFWNETTSKNKFWKRHLVLLDLMTNKKNRQEDWCQNHPFSTFKIT